MKILKIASSLLAGFTLAGCFASTENKNEVTVYVSADEQIAREVFAAFTEKTGIEVSWVGDTEASKTTALVQRLQREKNNPIADVFWSSEILGTIRLAQDKIIVPAKSEVTLSWPAQHRDASFLWFAFSPRARGIAYRPLEHEETELPKTWWEFGAASMADPRFGTTRTHVAVMALFPEAFTEFLKTIKGKPLLGGNAATVQQVVDGTATFAMTDSDDVHASIARGESVAMHYPSHHDGKGGGTLLIPNTVAIIRSCAHPELANQFVDFMLSDEVALLLATSTSHNIPLQRSVAEQFPELQVDNPLQVDFTKASALEDEAIARLMKALSHESK